MVINTDNLITDNQNTTVNNQILDKNKFEGELQKEDFDLKSNNETLNNNLIENANTQSNITVNFNSSISSSQEINNDSSNNLLEKTEEHSVSDEKETVETNCLALTVRKDYNFAIAKNTVFKTIRMSIKVAISTFLLNLIKLFF